MIIVLILLLVFIFLEFILNPCGNKIIDSINFTDENKIVLFERDCGATTGYSYHLSIFPRPYLIDDRDTGNLVIYKGIKPNIKVNKDGVDFIYRTDGQFFEKKNTDMIKYVGTSNE